MKKSSRKFFLASGIIAAGVAAFAAGTRNLTRKMVKAALDREMPEKEKKNRTKLAGRSAGFTYDQRLYDAADKLKNTECETIEITGQDGIRLIGHWRPCPNARRVIVAMHGWRSSWDWDFGSVADFLYENGCSVLYAEQRGQGNSGGDYMGFGLLERYDCLDWVEWVNSYCGADMPVYLAGISMGATTVLMAAGLDLPGNVRGILADCGFTSPYAIWKHVAENNLHVPYGLYEGIADDMCREKIQMGSREYSTVDAMACCKVPVLFIHGTDDSFVPVKMTYDNYKACVAPKRVFIVPGADHGMSYLADPAGYEKQIREFWEDYDFPGEEMAI